MQLRLRVPKQLGLKRKIVDKYTGLYREYSRFYPDRKDYSVIVQDAHYEGDHHNDVLLSKPYDFEDLMD